MPKLQCPACKKWTYVYNDRSQILFCLTEGCGYTEKPEEAIEKRDFTIDAVTGGTTNWGNFHICANGNKIRRYPRLLCSLCGPHLEKSVDFDPLKHLTPEKILNETSVCTTCTGEGCVQISPTDFDLCRICFREFANEGKIPGIKKSSW